MKFYVNKVYNKNFDYIYDVGKDVIGLFKECSTEGRGNFCGYYASEYYLNTELYAFYIVENGVYQPELRISEVIVYDYPTKYDEIKIGSHMWTMVIEADTLHEAIKKFKRADWRMWTSSEDEIAEDNK